MSMARRGCFNLEAKSAYEEAPITLVPEVINQVKESIMFLIASLNVS